MDPSSEWECIICPMGRLQGKAAFVTGAGAGIGRAIADALAREGATVARVDIDGKTPYQCDVSDRAAVFETMKRFVAETGGLDILVNNAVYFHYAPLVDMPEDKIHRMLAVGLKGVFWCTQAATPHLVARGGGSIINLSSVAVSFGITNACVYSSIKGAIDTFTRQQAVELAPHGIRVNALAPGPVSTPGSNSVIDAAGWDKRRSRTPLQRLATAEEVASAAVYLASDDARSIAGVTLKIDGAITVVGP
jgi:NAD(P)-dependent dehydrogenase (short-subunit alcohol dehydrogenase family)